MSFWKSLFTSTVIDTIVGFDIVKRPDPDAQNNGDYLIRMHTEVYVFNIAMPHQRFNMHNIKRVKTRAQGEKIISELKDWNFDRPIDAFNKAQEIEIKE